MIKKKEQKIFYCKLCRRKLGNNTWGWTLQFVGMDDLIPICEECNMSVTLQIEQIYKDNKKHFDWVHA